MIRQSLAWLFGLAGILGSQSPMLDADELPPDDHQDNDDHGDPDPPELPAADRARLDAAAAKRAMKGRKRRVHAAMRRAGAESSARLILRRLRPEWYLFALALLAALLGCAPLDGEAPDAPPACEAGAVRTCAGCRVGALHVNLPGASTCEPERDGGPLAWGPCRCGGSTP